MSAGLEVLPPTWRLTRLDRVADVNARIGWKALTAAEYQQDGFAFLATPNIKHQAIDFVNVNFISEFRYDESPELKLREGDVLLAKDGNTLGIVNIVRELPRAATVNGSIAVLRTRSMDGRFLKYVLESSPIQGEIAAVKGGMGVPHLFQWDIKRFRLPAPPLEEQRRIADFLDTETSRIDNLRTARENQMRCLRDLSEALTADQVENLFDQYGKVALRRFTAGIEQGWSPQCDEVEAEPYEWAVLKTSAVSTGTFRAREHKRLPSGIEPSDRYQVRDGDILLTRGSGSAAHVGVAALARTEGRRLLLSDLLYRVRLNQGWSPEFVQFALSSKPVRGMVHLLLRGQSGQTIKLRAEDVGAIEVPFAPLEVQHAAVQRMAQIASQIAEAVVAVARSNALLAERRQALITAAVTGQFDVSTASGRNITQGV